MTAGGGVSRRVMLLEYAVTLSRIDFSDTRWTGVIRAIMYMTGMQTDNELKRASGRLQEMAKAGDTEAQAALGVPDKPQRHWSAVYEAVERIGEDAKASLRGSDDCAVASVVDNILDYNADIINFGAFTALSKLLEATPGLFSLIQGGSQWAASLKDELTSEFPDAVSATRQLMTAFQRLGDGDGGARNAFVDEVVAECRKYQQEMLDRAAEYGELEPDDRPAAEAANAANLEKARKKLSKTLREACAALASCAAMDKLEVVLQQLQVKGNYNILRAPPSLPLTDPEMYKFLGVPASWQTWSKTTALRAQWEAHKAHFKPRPEDAPVPSPGDTYKYWESLRTACPELAELALTHLQRPVGSAAVERVFSFLTDMDDTHRRSMKREMLRYVLFLRGNWRVVQELRARYAATYDVAAVAGGSTAPRVGEKRKQQAAAVAGASAALHAASAAGAGAAAAAKRARRESDSSSDDSDEAQFDPAMEDDD